MWRHKPNNERALRVRIYFNHKGKNQFSIKYEKTNKQQAVTFYEGFIFKTKWVPLLYEISSGIGWAVIQNFLTLVRVQVKYVLICTHVFILCCGEFIDGFCSGCEIIQWSKRLLQSRDDEHVVLWVKIFCKIIQWDCELFIILAVRPSSIFLGKIA